jgi:hypothetical protein
MEGKVKNFNTYELSGITGILAAVAPLPPTNLDRGRRMA